MASLSRANIVNGFPHTRHGIFRSGRKPCSLENIDVGKIVSDIGDFGIGEAELRLEAVIDVDLPLQILMDLLDPKLCRAPLDNLRCAPGEDPDEKPSPPERDNAVSILNIELLQLLAVL